MMFQANHKALNLTLHELMAVDDIEKVVQEETDSAIYAESDSHFFKEGKLRQIPAQHKKRAGSRVSRDCQTI